MAKAKQQVVNQVSVIKEEVKETKTVRREASFKRAFKKLIYLNNGEFSMTRIIMTLTFLTAIGLVFVSVVAYLAWDKTLPNNIFSYTGALAGSGVLQYSYTKYVTKDGNGAISNGIELPSQKTSIPDRQS